MSRDLGRCGVRIVDGNGNISKTEHCRRIAKGYLPNGVPACWRHLQYPNTSMNRTMKEK